MNTEPDPAEREALGEALANDPLLLPRKEWEMVLRAARAQEAAAAQADIDQAVAAEKERIAQVAEDVGAHYHGADGQSAPFADLLRGARS